MGDEKKPDYQIFVSGSKVRDDVKASVIQITVDERLDQAAVSTIELRDENALCSGGGKFKIGDELKVEMGYVGATQVVFEGEITGMKGTFPRKGPNTFSVIAMDRFHRLRRNRRVQVFLNQKDSDVVSTLCGAASLSADAEATPITFDHLFQVNQTDADYILERAKLYGYEVFVEGKQSLKFRKPKLDDGPVSTLKWHQNLKDFAPTISLLRAEQVKVTAWNMKEKKELKFDSKKGDERSLMGGQKPASEIMAGKFGAPILQRAFFPASVQQEVEVFAKGLFQEHSEQFVTGQGTANGDPKIRRAKVIKIEEIGQFLSGNYYVAAAIHTLLPASGYSTAFRVRKTALKQAPAPPPVPPPSPSNNKANETKPIENKHSVVVNVVGADGASPEGVSYTITLPDGSVKSGKMDKSGKVNIEGIKDPGEIKIKLDPPEGIMFPDSK